MIKILLIMSLIPSIAVAGRHSIARGEATKIVNARFEEFYRNEARRKQEEKAAMEREMARAKLLAASMLRGSQQTYNHKIMTADKLASKMAREVKVMRPNVESYLNSSLAANDVAVTAENQKNNPLLLLKNLKGASPAAKQAAVTQVVESLQGLPNSQELATDFAQNLATISPSMSAEFLAEYRKTAKKEVSPQASYSSRGTGSLIGATSGNKATLLLLKNLEQAAPEARTAAINQVISDLQSIDDPQLIPDFTKDLAAISPSMSAEFLEVYQNTANQLKNTSAPKSVANNYDTFFDVTSGTKESNPFLFLKGLEDALAEERAAGIKEVLESLPDNQELITEFSKDLAKVSPSMATAFNNFYKTKDVKLSIPRSNNNSNINAAYTRSNESQAILTEGETDTIENINFRQSSKGANYSNIQVVPTNTIHNKDNNGLIVSKENKDHSLLKSTNINNNKISDDRSQKTADVTKNCDVDFATTKEGLIKNTIDHINETSNNQTIEDNLFIAQEKLAKHKNINNINLDDPVNNVANSTKAHNKLNKQLTKHYNSKEKLLNNNKSSKQAQIFNAITTYNFVNNNLYKIYTAPHKVTTISFAANETIVGTPICGDTVRWKINMMVNKVGGVRYQYLMIQPLSSGLTTSITIITNQGRLYVLEATSLANNYMAVVRWSDAAS